MLIVASTSAATPEIRIAMPRIASSFAMRTHHEFSYAETDGRTGRQFKLSDQRAHFSLAVCHALFFQLLGNQERQLQRLIGVEARVAMRVVAV